MELPVIVDCLIFLSWSLCFLLKVFIAYFPAGLYFLFIFVLPGFSLFYIVYHFYICLSSISFYLFSCSNTNPVLYTFHILLLKIFLFACLYFQYFKFRNLIFSYLPVIFSFFSVPVLCIFYFFYISICLPVLPVIELQLSSHHHSHPHRHSCFSSQAKKRFSFDNVL